jgi:CRP/FNR family cyclic AMP-dependent transcriptional regulator
MQPRFWPDQIDAHRLLAELNIGRATASYQNNQKIYGHGEDADFVFFVQEGCVRLTITSKQGVERELGIAREGQFFGEACLHDVAIRMATARAIGDCRITSVTKEAILSAIHSRPQFAKLFIDYLSDHNSWVEKHMLDYLLHAGVAA